MIDHTPLPPKATPLPQKAQRVSSEEHIPSSYKKATAGPFNLPRPSRTITAGESLEQLLRKTLQRTKELEIQLK